MNIIHKLSNLLKNDVSGMYKFLQQQNVIQTSVGLIVGLQLTQISSSFISNIISPILLILLGGKSNESMEENVFYYWKN